jgi:uncharacterized protein YqgC (DUF456 family)
MKIFYDSRYLTYEIAVDDISGAYYSNYLGNSKWDLIEAFEGITMGTRQVPDTVLILTGAPELEINE